MIGRVLWSVHIVESWLFWSVLVCSGWIILKLLLIILLLRVSLRRCKRIENLLSRLVVFLLRDHSRINCFFGKLRRI